MKNCLVALAETIATLVALAVVLPLVVAIFSKGG